jgi:succinate dehydrogenase / fumarate reductase, cytochrome b subunit
MASHARPLSPHLQIYRLPLVAITSITHRITGVALSAGLLLLSCWLAAAASGPETFQPIHDLIASVAGRIVMIGFSAALFFHLINGIRHLIWDTGRGLNLTCAQTSNRVVIGATVVLTALAWIIALA